MTAEGSDAAATPAVGEPFTLTTYEVARRSFAQISFNSKPVELFVAWLRAAPRLTM